MKTFLISYDLGLPETHASYIALATKIKSLYGTWAKPLKSVWIVRTEKSAPEIRDEIKIVLDGNDKLIVLEISGSWGSYNISKEVTDWMKRYI